MDLQVVNFHYVDDRLYAGSGIMPIGSEEFRYIIETLVREREPISLTDLCAVVCNRSTLPKKAVLVTFDDGLRCQWTTAIPILESLQVPAAFFVCTEPLISQQLLNVHKLQIVRVRETSTEIFRQAEAWISDDYIMAEVERCVTKFTQYRYDDLDSRRLKLLINFVLPQAQSKRLLDELYRRVDGPSVEEFYMGPDEWRLLGERGALGAHSHCHRPLAALSAPELEADLRLNAQLIRNCTGEIPLTISYPYGGVESITAETVDIASRLGFNLGFTMGRQPIVDFDTPLLLPRFDVRDLFPKESYEPS
jgi:peptidoglycan/xylan/chitin deacetylase (PgdA/CDA1 family)